MSFYQENIKEWTHYYNDPDRLRAFAKIEEWYSLWDDRLKLETCMKDPKRLGNFKVNSNNFTIKAHSLCKQCARSSFFEKGTLLTKPFQPSQS